MSEQIPAQREKWTKKVAAEIRAEAARQRVTQLSVAKALGKSQAAMSRRWNGDLPYDLDELQALTAFLDMSLGDLLESANIRCNMHGGAVDLVA